MEELTESVRWGYATLIHYFLAGVGGGTLTISATLLILSRRHEKLFGVARYAALIAPIVILDDAFVLVLELGRPARFLNIFTHVNFESPMWIGSWLMVGFLVVSTLYAYTYLGLPGKAGAIRQAMQRFGVQETPGLLDRWSGLRWSMAIIGLPLGIAVCHYPGFMMSGLVARPLWSTSILPTVTMLSGVVTGLASVLLCRILLHRTANRKLADEYRDNNYLLSLVIVICLLAEMLVLIQILIFAKNTNSSLQHVVSELLMENGTMVTEFWFGVIGLGFAVPLIFGSFVILPRLVFARNFSVSRVVEAVMPISVLIGTIMLIYVLLIGGQLTGPVGL